MEPEPGLVGPLDENGLPTSELSRSITDWARTRWEDYKIRYALNTESLCTYLDVLHGRFPHRVDFAVRSSARRTLLVDLKKYDDLVTSIIERSANVQVT